MQWPIGFCVPPLVATFALCSPAAAQTATSNEDLELAPAGCLFALAGGELHIRNVQRLFLSRVNDNLKCEAPPEQLGGAKLR
jgi:hypothetical protein